jgi:hypothetical protein
MAVWLLSAWEKREWGWAVQWQSPFGRSVGQSVLVSSRYWGSRTCVEYDRHSSGALSDDIVDVFCLKSHERIPYYYEFKKHVSSRFTTWKFGCVLNSMYYFYLRKSREYHFPRISGLTRRAVNFTNSEMYSFAKPFPLQIPFWKCGASSSRGRLKFYVTQYITWVFVICVFDSTERHCMNILVRKLLICLQCTPTERRWYVTPNATHGKAALFIFIFFSTYHRLIIQTHPIANRLKIT